MEFSKIGKDVGSAKWEQYQNKSAIREVLGGLILEPNALTKYPLERSDFVEPFHQIVFAAIVNLARQENATELSGEIIDQYLKEKFPAKYNTFTKNNGIKYIKDACELASNLESNYKELKKWSLLRGFLREGIDVSYYFNPDDDVEQAEIKRDRFNHDTLQQMMYHYETSLSILKQEYVSKFNRDHRRAGGQEALDKLEEFKRTKNITLSYCSQYFTNITYGLKRGHFTIGSAATGVGKTRMSIANMCYSFAPKFYDKATKQWIDNPHGDTNKALYIGTEMELLSEVEPIIWAYMADVNTDHILSGAYDEGEEERVRQAIAFLGEAEDPNVKGGIYLEYLPSFTVSSLEAVIREHVDAYDIKAVFFDYMFPSAELLNEYRQYAGNMGNREDQALNYLSTKLKDIARENEVSIDTWTQVSGDWKNDQIRDQTIVRGSKGVIDKCDTAFIASRPTENEINKLKEIRDSKIGLINEGKPNLCLTVYKNRSGRYNDVKIWLYVDYGSMRVHDLYATYLDFEEVIGLQKSFAVKTSDGQCMVFTSRDARERYEEGLISKEEYMSIQTQEKNSPSYSGNFSREDELKLKQLERATVGGALLGKANEEITSLDDEADFDY